MSKSKSDSPATSALCGQFGINSQVIAERLGFLQLSQDDYALADRLQQSVVKPNLNAIVDRFYEHLFSYPQAAEFLHSTGDLVRLKQQQKDYLLSLGRKFDTVNYFESRLQVGVTHLAVGVGLSLYQYAYFAMQKLLLEYIPPRMDGADQLAMFVLKITNLDLSLAIEAYEGREKLQFDQRIRALTRKQESLRKLADTDTLTGVLRRKPILDMVAQRLATTPENEQVFVMLADLDHFKKINDTYGHLVGDFVLKDTVNRIRATVRRINPVGRYGGEEFIILLSETNLQQASAIAERVRERIADQPIRTEEHAIPVTISIGIAALGGGGSATELIELADKALYKAKRGGRNRVESCIPTEE